MAAWTQGNVTLTTGVTKVYPLIASAADPEVAGKGQMWRQITFMVSAGATGRFIVLGGTGLVVADLTAATRKGVVIYSTEDATAEGPFAGLKRFHVEGPVDLSKLNAIGSADGMRLHWFGHKLGAE